jgi:hypothetical protein
MANLPIDLGRGRERGLRAAATDLRARTVHPLESIVTLVCARPLQPIGPVAQDSEADTWRTPGPDEAMTDVANGPIEDRRRRRVCPLTPLPPSGKDATPTRPSRHTRASHRCRGMGTRHGIRRFLRRRRGRVIWDSSAVSSPMPPSSSSSAAPRAELSAQTLHPGHARSPDGRPFVRASATEFRPRWPAASPPAARPRPCRTWPSSGDVARIQARRRPLTASERCAALGRADVGEFWMHHRPPIHQSLQRSTPTQRLG